MFQGAYIFNFLDTVITLKENKKTCKRKWLHLQYGFINIFYELASDYCALLSQ